MSTTTVNDNKENKLRVALIGLGYRGSYLLKLLLSMPQWVEVVGIADPHTACSPHQNIRLYNSGNDAYQILIKELCPDWVIVASPWAYHIEQALYAAQYGCHMALEIKPGLSLDYHRSEYEELIELTESKGLHCFPLENALFKREILSIWQMVAKGVFGELVHLRGGYRHDLRAVLLDEEGHPRKVGEGAWRYAYYEGYNADIYPTHGFAPLALIAGLGESDSIKCIYSQGSKCLGLERKLHHKYHKSPKLSDIITTQIQTQRGLLINLTHDTSLPRPRSLDWEIQGTQGIWDGERRRIYIEGISPHEQWEEDETYIDEYLHPYWREWGETALQEDKHHSGMDYIMLRAIIADLQGDRPYPATLRDLALWCNITPLSAASLRKGKAIQL